MSHIYLHSFFPSELSKEHSSFKLGDFHTVPDDKLIDLEQNWHSAIEIEANSDRNLLINDYIKSFGPIRLSTKDRIIFAMEELVLNCKLHGKKVPFLLHIEKYQNGYWLKAKDHGGVFSRSAVDKIYESIFSQKLVPNKNGQGAGIGLGMVMKMCEHFYIFCQNNKSTVVCCYLPENTAKELLSFAFIKKEPN